MSKPSQKQNSTTNQTTNGTSAFTSAGTSQPNAPDWITNAIQGITGNIGALSGANPQNFVAGSNGLIDRSGAIAGGLTGSPYNYDAGADLTRSVGQASAPDIASMTRSFMDPYLKQVVGATSNDLDRSDNIARQQSDLSNPAAFGGSGIALTKGNLEDTLSRARATTLGGLRSQGYSQALGGAEAQAQAILQQQQQRLGAAGQLGDLSSSYDANQRANAASDLGVGSATRGITQDQLSAPLNLQTWASQTLPDLLRNFFGNTTTGSGTTNSTQNTVGTSSGTGSSNPGALSSAGDLAMIASLFMSDRRLKTDATRIGERPDGLGLWLYRYIGKARWFIGVMADEVARLRPDAVRERPDGYLEVNYSALA